MAASVAGRARVIGVVAFGIGAIAAVAAIIALANAAGDGALVGGGAVAVLTAVLALLTGGYGLRFARSGDAARPALGPLGLIAVLTVIVGVLGSMGAFVLSSAVGSQNGAALALVVLTLTVVLAITEFALIRIARATASHGGA